MQGLTMQGATTESLLLYQAMPNGATASLDEARSSDPDLVTQKMKPRSSRDLVTQEIVLICIYRYSLRPGI